MKILYINTFDPYHEAHGGAVLARRELNILKSSFDVDVLFGTPIRARVGKVNWFGVLAAIFRRESLKVHLYSDIRRSEISYCEYDLIYCCHDFSAIDYEIFERLQIPYIVRKLNVESNVLGKQFNLIPGERSRLRKFERKVCSLALAVMHVSYAEFLDDDYSSRKIWCLPPLLDSHAELNPARQENKTIDVFMVSNFNWWPNKEGVNWFLQKVWPLLSNRGYKAVIVGLGSTELKALEDVSYLGYVDDLEPLYSSAKVVICPILSGAGIKMKVLEAVANGVPLVTTSIGLAGLEGLEVHSEIRIADTEQRFAEELIDLIENASEAEHGRGPLEWLESNMLEPKAWVSLVRQLCIPKDA